MALTRTRSGQYVISNNQEAKKALNLMLDLQNDISNLQKEHGIDEMMVKATELKKAVTAYCKSKNIDTMPVGTRSGRKTYARMVKSYSRFWAGTQKDIPLSPDADGAKPLKSLVSKEMWLKLTRRVPDSEKIEKAVDDGLVELEDIQAAYVEIPRAPYLRVYDEADEE